ncbi:transcobalamin-2 isoform X2 [Brachyhypopomus gauderio]|uniref:transcobalamin-2 isoform X2 n=1 Tax=Brachyhypopomus gauderio TaxID=698409 RepID=UPI004042EE9F
MKMFVIVASLLAALAARLPACDGNVLLHLNQELLGSTVVAGADSLPNPSVHVALRLSTHHNLLSETQHLHQLKTKLHDDIQKSISEFKPVVGRLALYVLALKASCQDPNSLSLSVNNTSKSLLTHLKTELHNEKIEIASKHRPKTNYYQYSLGVLALCVSGVRVDSHVSHKLIHAIQHQHIKHGDAVCIDSLAMAGMALQCLKDARTPVISNTELENTLASIKITLLESVRADGHMGNEFSTGLAVQALLAMGAHTVEYSRSFQAMMSDAKKGVYHNAMAISQTLPALQRRSYLHLKNVDCKDEDDTLTWTPSTMVPEVKPNVRVEVKVMKATGQTEEYLVDVPSGSSLLEAFSLLQEQQEGFTFEMETSLWGPFLSRVNGEWARQSDRRYWHMSSDGKALSQGMKDYKVDGPQKITIKNTEY